MVSVYSLYYIDPCGIGSGEGDEKYFFYFLSLIIWKKIISMDKSLCLLI